MTTWEGEACRRKRHGAPNREPPKIRSDEAGEPLCPMRGDDFPAGMVRVPRPAPRSASLGMRSVRLQIRNAGHLSRPIGLASAHIPMRHKQSPRLMPGALSKALSDMRSSSYRSEIGAKSLRPSPPVAVATVNRAKAQALRARAKPRGPRAPPSRRSQDARQPATATRSRSDPRTGA